MSRREHWTATRLKYVADCNRHALPEDSDPDLAFTYVDIGNVTQGQVRTDAAPIRFADAPSRARRLAEPGDTVVSTVRTYLRAVATVPEFEQSLVFSTGFAVLHPGPNVDPAFLSYYLQGDEFVDRVVASSAGVSYPAITPTDLMRLEVRLPELSEQHGIASHLDRETAKIDALISEEDGLVKVLHERRKALITRAVTLGLRQTPLKASTLSWVDAVPEHWVVANLRRFAQMRTGHTPSRSNPDFWLDCSIPWFTLADVWQLRDGKRTYLGDTETSISELGLANSAAELLPAGTVVLSRTASVGFSGIMPRPMATSQDFWNWVCGPRLSPEYLLWVFRAMRDEFNALMTGSTHKTIYQPVAAAIRIPVPPVDEQREIADYLAEQTEQIDVLIAEAEGMVAIAKERRSALITAAVTGQIDVRGEVA